MNKKTYTNKKKAFSLIELSIVLIIIGLLVAGVTGGASLIKNAELRKIVEEARGFQTAVNSFYAKYNALPGDFGTAIGANYVTQNDGNNNGAIEFVTENVAFNAGPPIVGGVLEGLVAIQMLVDDNFIDSNFVVSNTAADYTVGTVNEVPVALTGGINIPSSNSQGGGWMFDRVGGENTIVLFGGTTAEDANTDLSAVGGGLTMDSTLSLTSLIKSSILFLSASLCCKL